MKCPLAIIGEYGRENILRNENFDCLGEECAWWLAGKDAKGKKWKGCAMVYLVWVLHDIAEKMPDKKEGT